ncbi:MAG: hypothetical protein JWP87_1669 [Labilithrix sp.]|nr:hypothetical protein [Labilithrix sp.]
MLTSRSFLCVAVVLVVSSVTAPALASEPEPELELEPDAIAKADAKPHDDLLFTAGAGMLGDERHVGGTLALTGLRQKGWLGYGATFEYSGAVFDYTSVTAAPMVGVFVDAPRWARVGVAAVGGIHSYSGVGAGFIGSSDPGASGTTAFVGARLFAGAEVGNKTRFHFGLQLSADDDLSRTRTPYTFEQTAFVATARTETASHTVGTFRLGAMLALGTAFDL